jgi:hypothetical protein
MVTLEIEDGDGKDANALARIWYQSFVDPEEQAPYIDRLRARLTRLAAPASPSTSRHRAARPLLSSVDRVPPPTETIRNALTAEREGYDAFVIGHFQEPGLT